MIDLAPPPLILPSHYEARTPAIIRLEPDPEQHFPQSHRTGPEKAMLPGMIPIIAGRRELWTPDALSPRVWLDTTLSGISKDGSNQVAQWDDISGNGRHAIQATATRKPIHSAANSWIAFSATARYFSPNSSPGFLPTGNSSWTFASVFQFPTMPSSNPTAISIYRQGSGANNQFTDFGVGRFNGPYNRFYFSHYAFESNGSTLPAVNTDYIAVWIYDSTVGRTLYVNGSLDISNAYVSQNLAAFPSTYSLGADSASTDMRGESRQRTDLAFTGALSTVDRQKLEGYLAHKWGLLGSLPVGHPYKVSPPYV